MVRRPLCWLTLTSLALLVASCSATGARGSGGVPAWAESGKEPRFPPGRYVLGIGYGDTMDQADDRARGEVAKFFRAKVVSVTREQDSYQQAGSGPDAAVRRTFESRTHTRVRGEAELLGVEIVERAQDRGTWYALAVLDKARERMRLEEQVALVETELEEALETPGRPYGPRIKALARALYLHHRRAAIARRLRLVGREIPVTAEQTNPLSRELHDALRSHAPVVVEVQDERLGAIVRDAATGAGLVVAPPGPGGEPVMVSASVEVEVLEQGERVMVHYQVHLTARQGAAHLADKSVTERLGHVTAEAGLAKAFVEIRKRAVEPFVLQLQAHLLGDFTREDETP